MTKEQKELLKNIKNVIKGNCDIALKSLQIKNIGDFNYTLYSTMETLIRSLKSQSQFYYDSFQKVSKAKKTTVRKKKKNKNN